MSKGHNLDWRIRDVLPREVAFNLIQVERGWPEEEERGSLLEYKGDREGRSLGILNPG